MLDWMTIQCKRQLNAKRKRKKMYCEHNVEFNSKCDDYQTLVREKRQVMLF